MVIKTGILTISDRCSRGEMDDLSGTGIQEMLPADKFRVELYAVVSDDPGAIASTLTRWCDIYQVDLILTTGGTGLSPRDNTPEATQSVLHRNTPGISSYLMQEGLTQTPLAMLSRGVSGTRGHTLIVNLPGSQSGATQGVSCLMPILGHAIAVLKDLPDLHHLANSNSPDKE